MSNKATMAEQRQAIRECVRDLNKEIQQLRDRGQNDIAQELQDRAITLEQAAESINRLETGLGRPAALRRVFSGIRRFAASNAALGSIANRLLPAKPIFEEQDRIRVEGLAADRYIGLADRCTTGPIM